jgi:SAM-dependent methyltransferase
MSAICGRMSELALYDHPALYDLLVPPGPCERFYCELAHEAGGPVLELACGTGRLTMPLARTGQDVTGLDASGAMLRAARAKAAAEGGSARFVQGDMRSFDLGRRFALVIVSCNSLCHLTDHEDMTAALRRVSRHLAPGGLFAFDIVNPHIRDLSHRQAVDLPLDAAERPGIVTREELVDYDPVEQVRIVQWQVHEPGRNSRTFGPMSLRAIFPRELPLLLSAAGLDLIARHGDFDGNPLTRGSLNQVCLARAACDGPRQ